jgi:hypothetical protein
MTPRIYIFPNQHFGGDVLCYAIAEDGKLLASHVCSNESFAKLDLSDSHPSRRDAYVSHYPNGYVLEFVPEANLNEHVGLRAAVSRNKEKRPVAKADAERRSVAADAERRSVTTADAERLAREFRKSMTHEVVLDWGAEAAAAILSLVAERDALKAAVVAK